MHKQKNFHFGKMLSSGLMNAKHVLLDRNVKFLIRDTTSATRDTFATTDNSATKDTFATRDISLLETTLLPGITRDTWATRDISATRISLYYLCYSATRDISAN